MFQRIHFWVELARDTAAAIAARSHVQEKNKASSQYHRVFMPSLTKISNASNEASQM